MLLSSVIQHASAETYFAKIENGIVTNVIVADKDFADSQPGTWIQTYKDSPTKQYAGIGYFYNDATQKIIPLDKPQNIFNAFKLNLANFTTILSSELSKALSPKTQPVIIENFTAGIK